MNKIFQIGFNKCGTVSLYHLFNKCTKQNISSVHWDYGKLAFSMWSNLYNKKPLLNNYTQHSVFTDMEAFIYDNNKYQYLYMFKYFDVLDQQYPNSKFILNTRSIDGWIISRLNHSNNYIINNGMPNKMNQNIPYYIMFMKAYNINNLSDLIYRWKEEWYNHHSKVKEYFKSRPSDLLVFDIEKDNMYKIKNFLPNIEFTVEKFPLVNKTKGHC